MIWYLDHSAIAVETNNHLLLFDLFGKTLQPPKEMCRFVKHIGQ